MFKRLGSIAVYSLLLTSAWGCSVSADVDSDVAYEQQAATGAVPSVDPEPIPLCWFTTCYYVTNTNDFGAGSLRRAILDANAGGVPAEIRFDLPGAGPHVIRPLLPLPALGGDIKVRGFSQAGAARGSDSSAPSIAVIIAGSPGFALRGLRLEGGGNLVEGLAITGFPEAGLFIDSDDNTVRANFIGVDPTGVVLARNTQVGISVNSGSGNVIGGVSPGDRNVIGLNGGDGVSLLSSGNEVNGNSIGTDWLGTSALGNVGSGVGVHADDNRIGGVEDGQSNHIAHNRADGVSVHAGIGVMISRNSIHTNGDLSLDLADDGVTANDGPLDPDAGPNRLQNHPEIRSASIDTDNKVTVQWSLHADANTLYRVEFYANSSCDGVCEAERFVGSRAIRTSNAGSVDNEWTLPGNVFPGEHLTALSVLLDDGTPEHGSTSELAPCLQMW